MPELCAYEPCKCSVDADEMFCGDVCAMLGASLVPNSPPNDDDHPTRLFIRGSGGGLAAGPRGVLPRSSSSSG
jgi:hypothetical protein